MPKNSIDLTLSTIELRNLIAWLLTAPRKHRRSYFGALTPNCLQQADVTAQATWRKLAPVNNPL